VIAARYGSTGSGDAPGFTTDATNNLLEVTFSLPGGVLLITRDGGNVWSYPNVHGDVVAVADQAGVKQGPTRVYDPYGNPVVGDVPDNSAGDFDYGWLGQHQRPVEHEPEFQPIIEMGARQYSPLLGRFLEVDPVEGGSANDYDYVNGEPINDTDLDGRWPRFRCRWCQRAKGEVNRFRGALGRDVRYARSMRFHRTRCVISFYGLLFGKRGFPRGGWYRTTNTTARCGGARGWQQNEYTW
jgi:RHS repeat-associated protein